MYINVDNSLSLAIYLVVRICFNPFFRDSLHILLLENQGLRMAPSFALRALAMTPALTMAAALVSLMCWKYSCTKRHVSGVNTLKIYVDPSYMS